MKKDWGKWINGIIAVIMLGTLIYNVLSAGDKVKYADMERRVLQNEQDIRALRNEINQQYREITKLLLDIKQGTRSQER